MRINIVHNPDKEGMTRKMECVDSQGQEGTEQKKWHLFHCAGHGTNEHVVQRWGKEQHFPQHLQLNVFQKIKSNGQTILIVSAVNLEDLNPMV